MIIQNKGIVNRLCRKSLTIMPVLRDLYSGSKKSTSAYLPANSLSIAAQHLSCCLRRNHLHNTRLRVTMQPTATRNASHSASVNLHRKPGGKRFWPHRLPQTALEHPETVEIRAPKSKWNKLKSAENRYKRVEKVFPISLGPSGREFESPISDHNWTPVLIQCVSKRVSSFFFQKPLFARVFIYLLTKAGSTVTEKWSP